MWLERGEEKKKTISFHGGFHTFANGIRVLSNILMTITAERIIKVYEMH